MRTFTCLRVAIQLANTAPPRGLGRVAAAASFALVMLVAVNLMLGLALWRQARSEQPAEVVGDVEFAGEPPVLVAAEHRDSLTVDRRDLDFILDRGTLRVILPTLEEDHLPRNGSLLSARARRDLAASFADLLGVRLVLVLVKEQDEMLSVLGDGYGDLVVADLPIAVDGSDAVSYTRPVATVNGWFVGRKGEENLPRHLRDLQGREVHILRDSSYAGILESLKADQKLDLKIVLVEEDLDAQMMLLEVTEGKRP